MKLSNVCDEDLRKVALLKTRKGIATSDAKRAQQILYTRNVSKGGFGNTNNGLTTLEMNPERNYRSFEEENGYSLEVFVESHVDQNKTRNN